MSRAFRKGDRFISCSGSPFAIEYAAKRDDSGVINFVEVGRKNIYEEIQSHKDSVDINVLLTRYRNGDLSAFEQRQGFYGDYSDFPQSYAEMFQKIDDGKREFYKLPVDIREKFDNNYEKWMISLGSKDWFEKMGGSNVKTEAEVLSPDVGDPKESSGDEGSK